MADFRKHIEAEAVDASTVTIDPRSLISAAISLKRIADALQANYLERLASALEGIEKPLAQRDNETLRNCIAKAAIDRASLSHQVANDIGRLSMEYYKREPQ